MPSQIEEKFKSLSTEWKSANSKVPCAVYEIGAKQIVDRIVALTHGKGEKAGARQVGSGRRERGTTATSAANTTALDLLGKYLRYGENLTNHQKQLWGADYPLSVMKRQ